LNLTKEILEQEILAGNYLSWVRGLIVKARHEKNAEEWISRRKGLFKQLMEEALPIGFFSAQHFRDSQDVSISLKIGSQPFDACVNDKRKNQDSIKYIEVTTTREVGSNTGHDDYLNKLYLYQNGSNGTGTISFTGSETNNDLSIKKERHMVSQDEVLTHERNTVQEAINRKVKKSKHYPPNTALIIAFDDIFSFDREDNILNLESILEDNIDTLKKRNFSLVAIVGMNKELLIERKIN
jgi:hypothetical protein